MNLENTPVSKEVQRALQLLDKRELAKVKRLQAVLDGDEFTPELASKLLAARDQLQTDPTQIYLIIGNLLATDLNLCKQTIFFVDSMYHLSEQEVEEYVTYELLVRREADNKLSELIFQLLMKAKQIAA